jgi:hypothetical protein
MPGFALPPDWRPLPPDPWPETGSGAVAIAMFCAEETLSAREEMAFATLRRFGGAHPRFLLVPEGLSPRFPHGDFCLLRLPAENMASRAAYNALMLSPLIYRLFAGYRHVLIYQTDCLLLRGDLAAWCARDPSYVGPPWFTRGPWARPKAVGNGGFSLRSTADALAVLEDGRLSLARLAADPRLWRHFCKSAHALVLWRQSRQGHDAAQFVKDFPRPEDEFWSHYASLFLPGWRRPSPMEALDFAFEHRPRRALKLTRGRLPLGAHGWWKADEGFWVQRLATLGFQVEESDPRIQPPWRRR